jgi:hypothetical protein
MGRSSEANAGQIVGKYVPGNARNDGAMSVGETMRRMFKFSSLRHDLRAKKLANSFAKEGDEDGAGHGS